MIGGSAMKGLATGIMIAGAFSWFFGYLGGMPQLTTRFMAVTDKKQIKKARNIGVAWTIIAYTGALFIGWLAIALFGPDGLKDRETVMPEVITTLFNPWIAGILITGVLAAIVSTANSLLILSATELSNNLIQIGKKIKPKKALLQSRLVTAGLSLIALVMAYFAYEPVYLSDHSFKNLYESVENTEVIDKIHGMKDQEFNNKNDFLEAVSNYLNTEDFEEYKEIIYLNIQQDSGIIYTLVGYVWAGIGSTFSIVILLTLFWKRFHGIPALLTIITGLAFTIIWISTGMEKIVSARLLTFVVAGFVAILTSFVIPKKT